MSPSDQYFAGIIDGEGCITMYQNSGNSRANKAQLAIRVGVTMTCLPVIEALKVRFGGAIHKRKKRATKQQYSWSVCANNAKACLLAVAPFLIEKREQAEVAIAARLYQESYKGTLPSRGASTNPLWAQHYKKQAEFATQLKALKRVEFL